MMRRGLVDDRLGLKYGAGGRAMRALVERVCLAGLGDVPVDGIGLAAMDDGAALRVGDRWLVITTDSHVVKPIFFPGGDIGRLAVSGTVNDLAMMGATEPLGLTCAIILEEGFSKADLERVYASIREACREAHAPIVTGDTKVMGRGELDGLVVNTTGVALCDRVVSDAGLHPGDADRDARWATTAWRYGRPPPIGARRRPTVRCRAINGLVSALDAVGAALWP